MSLDITEDVMDQIGTPIIAMAVLGLIAGQVEAAGDVDSDLLDSLTSWPEEMRERCLADLREEAQVIRDWACDFLDVISSAEDK